MPVLTLGIFLLALVLIAPWGDYPTNDDWQYARAARSLAQTGRLKIDTAIAPAIVGQCYLVWPFVRLFGFSHTLLRITTLALAMAMLVALDRLLALGGVQRRLRCFATLLVALNPLFVNLGASFMSEIPGYAQALGGAWLWLWARRRADARRPATALPVLARCFPTPLTLIPGPPRHQ